MNYFELFEIPVSLQVDEAQLKQKFYSLSRKYHPDFYTQENETEQAEALERSSMINKAFKVFQQPMETIKYVLQLRGLLEEEEKYRLPPGFLMEMMELNELLADAKMEEDQAAINRVKNNLSMAEQDIYEPVKDIVAAYHDGHTTTGELLKVKEYYFQKKYLQRILAAIQ